MTLYEIYAESFVAYLKTQNEYSYTWELSEIFDLSIADTYSVLSELKNNNLINHDDFKGGTWWV